MSVTPRPCVDLTDVTLADEDTNSILTDNVNRAFQCNVAMRVTQLGGQLWNQAMQVTSPDDQVLNQFGTNQNAYSSEIQILISRNIANLKVRLYTLGPLCLWQCFFISQQRNFKREHFTAL